MTLADDKLRAWSDWCVLNLRRGSLPNALTDQMRTHGLDEVFIRAAMGPAADGLTVGASFADYAACALTQRVRATPGLKQLPARDTQIFVWDEFLEARTCEALMALIEANLRPSTVTDEPPDALYRTSKTCDLGALTEPIVHDTDARICEGLGI